MTSTVHHYSPANSPPVEGELDGRETAHEVEVLELQALQAERDGEGGRSVMLMERALQMRCRLVNRLREKWTNAASEPGSSSDAGSHRMSVSAKPDTVGEADLLQEYHAQCGELYDVAERLVVRCNVIAVEHFKRGAFSEASPLLEYAMQMTEDGAYPLCEVEERRRHLRGVTLNNIGCMERRRGHFSEALQYMKSSMEMTGVESPVAYMNTSAILIQLRLSEEAVRMAERSIELLYQTPEDPSLLAVAHHNLAMALEPVDPLRCLEEYALAYRTACSTLGPECETTRSIQRSWRRYEMTRVTPAMGPFFSPDGRAAASGLRGPIGTVPTKHAATAPRCLPATAPSRTNNSKSGGADSPMYVVELFPHPFLPSASTPSVSKAPRDVTPIYRPAVVPRRPLVPEPPPGVTTSSSRRSRAPHSQPHPQRQEQRQQQRRPYGTEKATHTSRLSTRTAVAAPRQSSVSRANEPEAAAGSGRVAAAMAPSPPPSRQQQVTAPRRYSPVTRAHESSRESPPRTGIRQGRLSAQRGTAAVPTTLSVPHKLEKSTSHHVHERSTKQTTPTALSSTSAQPPGRGSHYPTKESGSSNHTLPLRPPRDLPPLQTAAAAEPPVVAPKPSYSRSSRDAKANLLLPLTSASVSLESDPLTFLQNRLDVLLQDEEELEHKYAQATVIQRHYRGRLARRRVATLQATRVSDARLAQLRRHMLARRIQRAFRRRRRHSCYPLASGQLGRYAAVGGRHGAQHRTATQLQRIARGWLARRHYTQLRQYARESPAAASRIQCWIRALQARRRYAALHAEKALQEAEALEHERRQYAATRIAGQWLTYVQRKACKVALRNRMMARAAENAQRRTRATICIQSAWRGYQARRLYRGTYLRTSQLRTARLEYEQRRQAAVRLQSFGRMLIARQNATPLLTTARLRAAAEIRTRSREGLAAITIQCAYRSHVARRVCGGRRLMRKELTTQALLQAHTAIVQRTGRGYMARKDVGTKLSALQAEADRYERRLRALRQQDLEAARRLQQAFELNVSGLREGEDKKRCALELTEQQQRHHLLTQRNASLAATSETEAQQEGMIRASLATFHNFSRIIKAKKRRALRQESRDAYLERCAAEDAELHREASARVVTAFMRGAAARSTLLSRAETMSSYNDARAMQEKDEKHVAMTTDDDNGEDTYAASAEVLGQLVTERAELDRLRRAERLASEAPTSTSRRPLTAEQLVTERAELDRLRRAERLASETPASTSRRPLTAEQLVTERAELDRLRRAERLASEAPASTPRRPLTAEQLVTERAELDRLRRAERLASEEMMRNVRVDEISAVGDTSFLSSEKPICSSVLAREMMACQKAVWQAEVAAEKQRRQQRDALHRAIFEDRQQRIASATDGKDLAPYRISRIRRQMRSFGESNKMALSLPAESSEAEANNCHARRIAQLLVAVQCIESHFLGRGARKHLTALLRIRDDYLSAMQTFDRDDGPVLTTLCLREALARDPDLRTRVLQSATYSSPSGCRSIESVPSSASPSASLTSRKTLKGYLRIIKAKKRRALRQESRDAYLERCAAEDAELHREASARVVTAFMRGAAARSTLLSRAETMSSYNDARAMQEKDEKHVAMTTDDDNGEDTYAASAEVPGQLVMERAELDRLRRAERLASEAPTSTPRRPLTAEQLVTERAELDRLRRAERLASEAPTSTPRRPLTAEQLVTERAELDRLRRAERLASEAPASTPRRPLTAEQLVTERAELDRLRRAERLASEAPTSTPRRPLTAEQLVTERAELDSGVSVAKRGVGAEIAIVPDSLMLEQRVAEDMVAGYVRRPEKVVRDDEVRQPPRRSTEQQVAVECLALGQLGHLEQVGMEGKKLGGLSLVEYTLSAAALRDEMVQGFQRNSDMECTWTSSSSASSGPSHREDLTYGEACDRLSVFAEVVRDKKNLRQRQASRDTYLQDVVNKNTSDVDEEKQQEERASTPFAGGSAWQLCSEEGSCDDSDTVDQEAMLQLYRRERRSFVSSLVDNFSRIIKAKKRRALRQESRDAYLERCAAEDAELHREASARVVTAFMRGAAARSTLLSRAETMSSYNDARAMQEKDEKHVAMTTDDDNGEDTYAASAEVLGQLSLISSAARRIQRFVRAVQAGRMLRAQQESCRAYLEEERAVEEILHSAALTIQRLYRRHRARRLAAMAIVERDLCLLSPQESCEAKAACEVYGCDMVTSALSFRAHSLRGVISGCAEAAATSAFALHRTSSSSCSELCELDSTAIVTVVSEAQEAALDQLVHRS
ncbi:hypothetical protein LPMP_323330 [Leishmania panamensis]|uniref:hypothetical protein n=1 Tax=Leishmania panamensis TaxID=5679 RepID=UPI0004F77C98|nr:hypothetical protein LPMP_323330 [Leishmania panamensis]AIO01217.1 hypothetical protein LPMP_323330 [Leishmania panamensis]